MKNKIFEPLSSFNGVSDGSGGDSETYTPPVTTLTMNAYRYRCVVTNNDGTVFCNPAKLTVVEELAINYLDENGNTQSVIAEVLTGNETVIIDGWYGVKHLCDVR